MSHEDLLASIRATYSCPEVVLLECVAPLPAYKAKYRFVGVFRPLGHDFYATPLDEESGDFNYTTQLTGLLQGELTLEEKKELLAYFALEVLFDED